MKINISVTYQVISPESAENGDFEDQGFTLEPLEVSQYELRECIKEYGFKPREDNDLTRWWEADPFTEWVTGRETTYNLHVNSINGKPLSDRQLKQLNKIVELCYG